VISIEPHNPNDKQLKDISTVNIEGLYNSQEIPATILQATLKIEAEDRFEMPVNSYQATRCLFQKTVSFTGATVRKPISHSYVSHVIF
jgi:hypothetical protein